MGRFRFKTAGEKVIQATVNFESGYSFNQRIHLFVRSAFSDAFLDAQRNALSQAYTVESLTTGQKNPQMQHSTPKTQNSKFSK
jgi:hypothetical protein